MATVLDTLSAISESVEEGVGRALYVGHRLLTLHYDMMSRVFTTLHFIASVTVNTTVSVAKTCWGILNQICTLLLDLLFLTGLVVQYVLVCLQVAFGILWDFGGVLKLVLTYITSQTWHALCTVGSHTLYSLQVFGKTLLHGVLEGWQVVKTGVHLTGVQVLSWVTTAGTSVFGGLQALVTNTLAAVQMLVSGILTAIQTVLTFILSSLQAVLLHVFAAAQFLAMQTVTGLQLGVNYIIAALQYLVTNVVVLLQLLQQGIFYVLAESFHGIHAALSFVGTCAWMVPQLLLNGILAAAYILYSVSSSTVYYLAEGLTYLQQSMLTSVKKAVDFLWLTVSIFSLELVAAAVLLGATAILVKKWDDTTLPPLPDITQHLNMWTFGQDLDNTRDREEPQEAEEEEERDDGSDVEDSGREDSSSLVSSASDEGSESEEGGERHQLPPRLQRYNLRTRNISQPGPSTSRPRSTTPTTSCLSSDDEELQAPERARKIRLRFTKEREKRLCVVCQDNVKNVLLLPCRHMCLCRGCADHITNSLYAHQRVCPLCRSRIGNALDIYI
ncbi:protein localization to perinuclear region of cytoplasm [Branchiostoma belcheri]|nr:protein localization to perinuclear region of cytoplasm [Branchiostoma belcheri]